MTTLLGISGSLRSASLNTKLVEEAARVFAPASFVLGDINFPLYSGDTEEAEGVPDAVQTLSDQIAAADAVVISTPEYNKGPSGALKNALDWVSRTKGGPWAGKPVALMSATAGRAGGERAQFALRLWMVPFRARVLQGPEILVGSAHSEFDENGRIRGEMYNTQMAELMGALKAEIGR